MQEEKLASKNRKVYLMGDQSTRQFFSAPTRYLAESINKESEFEKPYLDDDRAKMHMDFPWPDWPTMPPLPPWPPLPPFEGPGDKVSACAITCYAPGGGDCTEPIWCHPSIWCGADLNCNLCSWVVEGATTGYTWKHIVNDVPSKSRGIEIWIDENLLVEGKALIHAQMTDPCGNLCGEDLEVTCKVCPPEIVISWDTAVETIGQSSSLVVAVKDGLGPYRWSVVGTGFSMRNAETAGTGNILDTDASACGTATITVTDYCEDTAVGYVRCTAISQWVQKSTGVCQISGPASWVTDAGNHAVFDYIQGLGKQQETILWKAGQSPGITCGVNDVCDTYCADAYYCLEAPFMHSVLGDITPNCYPTAVPGVIFCYCGHVNLIYSEWECS